MKKINIEKSLKKAVCQAPTVDFEKLAAIPVVKMAEHDYITRQQENRKPKTIRSFSVAVSFCLVMLVFFSGWFVQNRLPDSVIALDVNPSIEIVTNKQDRVLSVKALNEDAQSIVGDQDYKNADLHDTVDALLSSMVNQGYLSTGKNTIMITVENKSIEKAEALALQLDEDIKNSASARDIAPNVLWQVYTKDKDTSSVAEKYGISVGKLKLIQEIHFLKPDLSIDTLAQMPVDDLISISEEYEVDLDEIIETDYGNSDRTEDVKYPQPANTDQDDDDYSQPDADQDDDDYSQPDADQDDDDYPQLDVDQDDDNYPQPDEDQDDIDISQPVTEKGENEPASSEDDQDENDSESNESERNSEDESSDISNK